MDIKEVSYTKDEYNESLLTLNIKGEYAVYQILNSIRQSAIDQPYIYAYDVSQIKIIKNTTVYDVTETKLRLSQLPIYNIEQFEQAELSNELSNEYYGDGQNKQDGQNEQNKQNEQNELIIETYAKKKNNTLNNIYVTTNDLIVKINNKLIDNDKMYPKDNPTALSILRSNEELEFSMKTMLKTGEQNAIYNASSCFWTQINDNEYIFKMKCNEQRNPYLILATVCDIINGKLRNLKVNFTNKQYKMMTYGKNKLIIEICNENYVTFGPINYMLQNMNDIIKSGISKISYLEKKMLLSFETHKNDPLDNLFEAIDLSIGIYDKFKEKILKIYNDKYLK